MPIKIRRLDLNALPYCPTNKAVLPDSPVLYIIFNDTQVFYVGATKSLFNRWSAHRNESTLKNIVKRRGVKVAWIKVKIEQLQSFETALIKFLQPIKNKVSVGYHHANINRPSRKRPYLRLEDVGQLKQLNGHK